jgi:hypothetical protein
MTAMHEFKSVVRELVARLVPDPQQQGTMLASLEELPQVPQLVRQLDELLHRKTEEDKRNQELEIDRIKKEYAEKSRLLQLDVQNLERSYRDASLELRKQHDEQKVAELRSTIGALQ